VIVQDPMGRCALCRSIVPTAWRGERLLVDYAEQVNLFGLGASRLPLVEAISQHEATALGELFRGRLAFSKCFRTCISLRDLNVPPLAYKALDR
jgi:hypothetical protein